MLEDGSMHRPRPSREAFIPIEEVSSEHLHPYWPAPLTPEEILMQKQEAEENAKNERFESEGRHPEIAGPESGAEADAVGDGSVLEADTTDDHFDRMVYGDKYDAASSVPVDPAGRVEPNKEEWVGRPAQGWRGKEPRDKNKRSN